MKISICRIRLAVLPWAVGVAFPVLAQNAPVVQLPETVVTASRNQQLLGSALPHTTVISREDIERSQAIDLVNLLEREAGVQKTQTGGLGSSATIFMRGSPALQTLILIDGVPQTKQDASGAVSVENLMLDQIERVEIVRGNVSAIYGSGAIGGVIQIFTRGGSLKPAVTLSLDLGPRGFRKASGSFSTSVGDTTFSANLSRITTNGFSAVNPAQNIGANPDDDGYQNTSLNLAVKHQLTSDHSFGLRLFKSNSTTAYDDSYYSDLPTDIHLATARLSRVSLFSDNKWGNLRSRLTLSEQSDRSSYQKNESFLYGFVTRVTVLNWINTIALNDHWLATAGFEQQRQRVEAVDLTFGSNYQQQRATAALFAGVDGKLLGGDVQINLRRDKVAELEATTSYLGYGYPISRQLKIVGSVSTAFNAPPLGYLFDPFFGNPLLKPERARSRELGGQYDNGGQLLRATFFDTRTRNELAFDTTLGILGNVASTRNRGTELSYKGAIGATDLRAGLTRQNPTNEQTGERLQRRAATLLSVGVSHAVGAFRLGADVLYSGERPDAFTDASFTTFKTTLPSYTLLNLSAQYRSTPELLFKAKLDNVTDAKYQTVYGYNQQPRSLYVGAVWTPR